MMIRLLLHENEQIFERILMFVADEKFMKSFTSDG